MSLWRCMHETKRGWGVDWAQNVMFYSLTFSLGPDIFSELFNYKFRRKCRQSWKYRKIQHAIYIPLVLLFLTIFFLWWKSHSPTQFFFQLFNKKAQQETSLSDKKRNKPNIFWTLEQYPWFFSPFVNWDFPLKFWSIFFLLSSIRHFSQSDKIICLQFSATDEC